MDQQICPICKSILRKEARFCSSCGCDLASVTGGIESNNAGENMFCPHCNKKISKSMPYCDSCGYPLQVKTDKQQSVKMQSKSHWDQPTSKISLKKIFKCLSGKTIPTRKVLVLLSVLIGVSLIALLVSKIIINQTNENVLFDPCTPIKPGDDYALANNYDLSGDLKRDSFFKTGQQYTIPDQSTFIIPSGRTLIIEPGALVRFGKDARLIVRGTLLACGQTNQRILFTADSTTGTPGFWQGIDFIEADKDSILGHVTIEYAGGQNHSPLWLENVDLKIQDVRFDNNAWYGISIDPNTYPLVRDTINIDNGPQGWEVRAGEITKTIHWNNYPDYVVNGMLFVNENSTLTIEEGTVVRFLPSSGLIIKGGLQTIGTEQKKIILTSINDSDDEKLPAPNAGDWYGVWVHGTSAHPIMNFTEIRYAANPDSCGCLTFTETSGSFTNLQIKDCGSYAISMDVLSNPEFQDLFIDLKDRSRELEVRGGELNGIVNGNIPQIKAVNPDRVLLPVVTGWIGIGKESTLTINKGSTVLFMNSGMGGEGKISAAGTHEEPIIFTSWRDTEYNQNFEAKSGDWSGLYLKNSLPDTILSNIEIRFAGVDGSCLFLDRASPTISDLTIRKCGHHPISSDINSQPVVSNLDLEDNIYQNQWLFRESVSNGLINLVWDEIPSVNDTSIIRIIEGIITISPDANLELKSGLILKFGQSGGLEIQGGFSALGEQDAPIVLTSWRDPIGGGKESGARAGDWRGVKLLGTEKHKKIRHLQILYGGQSETSSTCLTLADSKPELEDITIAKCGYYPIASDLQSQPKMTHIELLDNYPSNDWVVNESDLPQGRNITWDPIFTDEHILIPRLVTGWLRVEAGSRLSISEGSVVKFSPQTGVYSSGTLEVLGTEKYPVIFTSWRDPEFSQESNVAAGDWSGIILQGSNNETRLQYTQIRYAGGENLTNGALALISASPIISNLKILSSDWFPISADLESYPNIQMIQLIDNQPVNSIEIRQSSLGLSGEYRWSPIFDVDQNQVPRVVTGDLLVNNGSALLIEPDTVVKFSDKGNIQINGGFKSTGAVFTSAADLDYAPVLQMDNPVWGGIKAIRSEGLQVIEFTNTIINQAVVGLWVENLSIDISNTKIKNCTQAAISTDLFSDLNVSHLDLENNSLNGVLIRDELLQEGVVRWRKLGEDNAQIARVLLNNLTVGSQASLILEPGVIVKFSDATGLFVDGELITGSSSQVDSNTITNSEVILTSLADDKYGGNTDNKVGAGIRGAWLGVNVNPNNTDASVELLKTIIQYAKIGLKITNMPEWTIDGLEISDSQLMGISCDAGSLFPSEEFISLINNGNDILGCPTSDR